MVEIIEGMDGLATVYKNSGQLCYNPVWKELRCKAKAFKQYFVYKPYISIIINFTAQCTEFISNCPAVADLGALIKKL